MDTNQEIKYIPALDGLRAVAVLLVLLYHAQLSLFGGGYLGVDIFFCISGYIISRQILTQLEAGQFSLVKFWSRRIARLFPALLLTLLVTLLVGAVILSETELRRLGAAALSNLFYLSNFFFWNEAGYFDADAISKPLLHTWSLAVEEQFYVVWPLCFLCAFALWARKGVMFFIAFATVVSWLGTVWLVQSGHSQLAFYMMPTRVFQFGSGALLGLLATRLTFAGRDIMAIFGLIGVLLCCVVGTIYEGSIYAQGGLIALLSALIFVGLNGRLTSVALGNRIMTFIGRRSYSIYLVHWPLFVFYFIKSSPTPSIFIALLGILLSIGLGSLLYAVIETPIRFSKFTTPKQIRQRLSGVVIVAIALAGLSTVFWKKGGITLPAASETARLARTKTPELLQVVESAGYGECFFTYKNDYKFEPDRINYKKCMPVSEESAYKILVLGDSSASAVYMALKSIREETGIVPGYLGMAGCPALRTDFLTESRPEVCAEFNRIRLSQLAKSDYDAVFVSINWNNKSVNKLVSALAMFPDNIDIFVIGETPRFVEPVPSFLRRFETIEAANAVMLENLEEPLKQIRQRNEKIRVITEGRNAIFIDVLDQLCLDTACPATTADKQRLRYLDKFHMSEPGSVELGQMMKPQILAIVESPAQDK